ncbi:DUF1365 domain-containing protein [Engelhardtia mirabilis]|uniref:DUF1365 domain-containing protein n=1 Tax=Engelhardtia mirabilis TaxID=2528011 RepID=A0A518BR65_9BACT|nr:hypothetical protein Pla133_45870 [Planctomycetes bacterium Pla133]QDV03793.1 hypothetical protein Pla86_45850 [Planctomycetes bacterium Pla86]
MSGAVQAELASCVYRGTVRHRRFAPRPHAFQYAITYLYLDLDELEEVGGRSRLLSVERPNLISFRRRDYHGDPRRDLREALGDTVEAQLGRRPAGPVRLLTQPAVMGRCFNPVSFYYCFEPGAEGLDAVVAEITNTPWGERRAYVLDARAAGGGRGGPARFTFPKDFHVSPFVDLDVDYRWSFGLPGDHLAVHMDDVQRGGGKDWIADGEKLFDATLTARRRELTPAAFRAFLARQPLASVQVHGAIYFQALRLWLRRTPTYIHPSKRTKTPERGRPGSTT